jgi:ATPase subunit of ABC transporter with duplicated ATPase domains
VAFGSCWRSEKGAAGETFEMSQQYIFTMEGVTKIYEQKEVLSDIWLSFYPGAKIGVLGSNGSGKSTLLRIMAGEDRDFMGTARPAKGGDDRLFSAGTPTQSGSHRR